MQQIFHDNKLGDLSRNVSFIDVKGVQINTTFSLRKHAYSNILKILPPKKWKFLDKKNSDIFHISAQNIDCGYS